MLLRRRRAHDRPAAEPIVVRVPDARVGAVHVFEDAAGEAAQDAARLDAWRSLRRIVAEALILQDAAEDLLLECVTAATSAPRCRAARSWPASACSAAPFPCAATR